MNTTLKAKGTQTIAEHKTAITPAEILVAALFLLWLLAPTEVGDDAWFYSTYTINFKGDMSAFLSFRYNTWSTRLLLEAITVLLVGVPILYKLTMPFCFLGVYASLSRLMGKRGKDTVGWALCAAAMLMPMAMNLRAGYVCTTVNYVFTLACLTTAVIPLAEGLRGKRIHPVWYPLSILLTAVGCNMEYYCPPMIVVCLLFIVLEIKRGRVPILSGLLLVIAALSLYYALSSPASTLSSYEGAAAELFPGFDGLSAPEKLWAGLVSTAGGMLSTYRHGDSFILGAIALAVLLLLFGAERRPPSDRWVFFLPLPISVLPCLLGHLSPEGSLLFTLFCDSDGGWLWSHPVTSALAILYFSSVLYCLARVDRTLLALFAIALFCRVTMGISRSLFASGLRTFYPLLFVVILATATLVTKLWRFKKAGWVALAAPATLMLAANLYGLLA